VKKATKERLFLNALDFLVQRRGWVSVDYLSYLTKLSPSYLGRKFNQMVSKEKVEKKLVYTDTNTSTLYRYKSAAQ